MTKLAIAACAAVSLALTLYAGRQSAAPAAVVLVGGWVFAPFVALLFVPARAAAVLLSLACASVYAVRVRSAPDSSRAAVFVIVPAVSWLVIAALAWRGRSRTTQ